MQYILVAIDGKEYGPVDLGTLQSWASEGRVLPSSTIKDVLSQQTMQATSIPELAFNVQLPPSVAEVQSSYPRDEAMNATPRGTKLWAIVFWAAVAVVLSIFTRYGGIIISLWNFFDVYGAYQNRDPKKAACLAVAIVGITLVATIHLLQPR